MNREKMIEAITTAILGKTAPKAAAQSLADAAHWAPTPLGKLVGGAE